MSQTCCCFTGNLTLTPKCVRRESDGLAACSLNLAIDDGRLGDKPHSIYIKVRLLGDAAIWAEANCKIGYTVSVLGAQVHVDPVEDHRTGEVKESHYYELPLGLNTIRVEHRPKKEDVANLAPMATATTPLDDLLPPVRNPEIEPAVPIGKLLPKTPEIDPWEKQDEDLPF